MRTGLADAKDDSLSKLREIPIRRVLREIEDQPHNVRIREDDTMRFSGRALAVFVYVLRECEIEAEGLLACHVKT